MREILVYEDYEIHKLGAGGGTQYEEVTTEKATRIDVTDVAKTKGKLLPFGRTTQNGEPTPENPIPIENVEGRSCRNLFDGEIELGSINPANGNLVDNSTRTRSKNFIKVKPNTTYTITRQSGAFRWIVGYTADKTGINDGTFQSQYPSGIIQFANGVAGGTFTTTATTEYIKWYDTVCTDLTEEVMLNKGSTALPYEEYFEGKRLEFNVCNKNLFDGEFELGSISGSTGQNIENSTHIRTKNFQAVEPNTTYRISKDDGIGISMYIYEYKEDFSYNLTSSKLANTTQSFTTNPGTKYVKFRTYSENTDVNTKLQLQKSSEILPYEEHKEQIILFPLQEGQKLMEGDYLADDGIHHIMGQIELSGASAETWYKNTDYSTENMLVANLSANNITDIKSETKKLKCSHFRYASPTTINSFRAIGNALGFGLDINSFTDVNEWKTWLQSNPIIVEYELKEEVVEPYTEAQAETYNKLMNLMLYKGVNHIWTETDGLEPNLQLTYKRKKQSNVLQVSSIQPLNNLELNNTEETPEEITTEISEE